LAATSGKLLLCAGGAFFAECRESWALRVAQEAWLAAVPEGGTLQRKDMPSVAESLKEPVPIKGNGYLIEVLFSVGPCAFGDMGSARAVSWQELLAWSRATHTQLSAWEFEAVHYLSRCYAAAAMSARSKAALPPHVDGQPRISSDEIKSAFRSIGSRKKQ